MELDPWGNPESPYMVMQRMWRQAEDRVAQYYHAQGLHKCSNCEALREEIARLRSPNTDRQVVDVDAPGGS